MLSLKDLARADPKTLADLVPRLLSAALAEPNLQRLQYLAERVQPDEWQSMVPRLADHGVEHRIYAAHGGLRRLSRAWMGDLLPDPRVDGLELFVEGVERGTTIIVSNHISYVDANVQDALFARFAGDEVSDRVAYLAGPKVYENPFLRVASAAISSLPVPQSTKLGHNQAALSAREVAARALRSVEAGQEYVQSGGILAFYPEGSRSRTGRMGSFLRGTRRYLKNAKTLVPMVIIGTDGVMSVESPLVRPAPVSVCFAPCISLDALSGSEALELAFQAIAERLPESMRPAEGTAALQ